MRTKRLVVAWAVGVIAIGALVVGPASRRDVSEWTHVERGVAVPHALRASALQAINADGGAEYAIDRENDERGGRAVFVAHNAAHALTAEFTPAGPRIVVGSSTLTLSLGSYGRGDQQTPVVMSDWRAEGARIERSSTGQASPLTEWYVNGPLGLEQGFTIASPPEGHGNIAIKLALSDSWIVLPSGSASAVRLHNHTTSDTLSYAGLHAVDAAGQPLIAALEADADDIFITVDAEGARYPITIDPFIAQQTLSAFDGEVDDTFGQSVALGPNTAVIGSPTREVARGAAYVFVRSNGIWSLQAKLIPNDPASLRTFGGSVAISGETVAVGAANGQLGEPGSVYVFVRAGTIWSQQAKLTAADAFDDDAFGAQVALDVNTLIVGAPGPRNDTTTVPGATYVFVRAGTSWSQQQKLQPGSLKPADNFGVGVAVSGDTLIAGAPRHDEGSVLNGGRAYVFTRTGTVWLLQQELAPRVPEPNLGFGWSTAVSGNRALVSGLGRGISGTAFWPSGLALAFERTGTTWTETGRFEPPATIGFGNSVALDGATGVIGSFGPTVTSGAFVTIVRFQQGAPPLTERASRRTFGQTVAINAATLLLGEPRFDPGQADIMVEASGPPAPPVVAAPVITGSTVDLVWTTSSGATRYQLRAGTSPGGSNAFNGDVGNVTTLKAVNVPNGSYFVRVFAVNGSGEGAASNEVRVDVGGPGPCTAPVVPQNLSRSVNGSLVSLTWNASTGATSYVVEAGSASGLANLAVIDTGSATPGLLANAPPGTYFVRVRAKNSCSLSPPSNQVTVTVN